jgi:hypothetical protein
MEFYYTKLVIIKLFTLETRHIRILFIFFKYVIKKINFTETLRIETIFPYFSNLFIDIGSSY